MKASVIVLAWNGREFLGDCLDALLLQIPSGLQVIVVDNGSADGSAELVAERFPAVRLIRNERNVGFAAGNNIGLREASGDVLVLLNQDTVVQPGWLAAILAGMEKEPQVGVIGSKALYPDGRIQHAGGFVDPRGSAWHYGRREVDIGQFDETHDVDFVTGAALAISRRAYDKVGGLDEGFTPAYYEDVDWCYRTRAAGFRVVYLPQATLVHKEASVAAGMNHAGMYLFQRNRLRFVLKHWSLAELADRFSAAEQSWLDGLGEGAEKLIAAVQHAYLYHLLHLGEVAASRQRTLGAPLTDVDAVAELLLKLRALVPLGPVGVGAALAFDCDQTVTGHSQTEVLRTLGQSWLIREHQFRSDVPVLGPLIAAFRRRWNRVSTEWYVRAMFQQQSQFNARVVTLLEQLAQQDKVAHHQRQRLGEVLAVYLGESGRELGDLARYIGQLRQSIDSKESGESK